MKTVVFWLVLSVCGLAVSQEQSRIDFVIRNLGVNVDGHFNRFSINAAFNSEMNLLNVEGALEVASIETGIDSRDEHLLKEDYFDAERYPIIKFTSNSVETLSQSNYLITADLTIKDITKEVEVPVSISFLNDLVKLEANFEINRKDFTVGGGSLILSKTVRISVIHYEKSQ